MYSEGSEMTNTEWTPELIRKSFLNRDQLVRAFDLTASEPESRASLISVVSEIQNLRPKYAAGLPNSRLASMAADVAPGTTHHLMGSQVLPIALSKYVLTELNDLVIWFLDQWSVPHEKGKTADPIPLIDPTKLANSVDSIEGRWEPSDVALYFTVAGLFESDWRDELWQAAGQFIPVDATASNIRATTHAQEVEPETRDAQLEFTLLDDLLIKSMVASVGRVDGALSVEQVGDVTEELISLSSDRHQSYFHRGYLNRLTEQVTEYEFPERNSSRFGWLLAGEVNALARHRKWEEIVSLHEERTDEFIDLLGGPFSHGGASVVTAPQLFSALWKTDRQAEAVALLNGPLIAVCAGWFILDLVQKGEDLLLDRNVSEATRMFEVIHEAILINPHWQENVRLINQIQRRRAQCIRALEGFSASSDLFQDLSEGASGPFASQVLSDLGLSDGSFRWLDDVTVPGSEDEADSMEERLSDGEHWFQAAIKEGESSATNAHYCLGVFALIKKDWPTATTHLEHAYSSALSNFERYRRVGVWAKLQSFLAITLIASGDEANFDRATRLFNAWEDIPERRRPTWLLADIVLPTLIASENQRDRLMTSLLKADPELVDVFIQQFVHTPANRPAPLIEAIVQRTRSSDRRAITEWDDLEFLLTHYLGVDDFELAADVLDKMESLVTQNSNLTDKFTLLLSDPDNYDPVWSEEEAAYSRAQLLERVGQYDQAAAIMTNLFHKCATETDLKSAGDILDHVRAYGLDDDSKYVTEMEGRLQALIMSLVTPEESGPTEVTKNESLHILFVGGNEVQKKRDQPVLKQLSSQYPEVTVDFIHTGWTSNWGDYVDEIDRKLPKTDAVVIMRLIRTNLGRSVRASANAANIPWVACTGTGRDSMVSSIVEAIELALKSRDDI